MYYPTYEKALVFAIQKHEGQSRDISGEAYINHPIRVASRLTSEQEKVVALLHDTIEDTKTTHKELRDEFGDYIATCVKDLSKKKNQSHDKYIDQVIDSVNSETTVPVKIQDIVDNLQDLPDGDPRLEKYARALSKLLLV